MLTDEDLWGELRSYMEQAFTQGVGESDLAQMKRLYRGFGSDAHRERFDFWAFREAEQRVGIPQDGALLLAHILMEGWTAAELGRVFEVLDGRICLCGCPNSKVTPLKKREPIFLDAFAPSKTYYKKTHTYFFVAYQMGGLWAFYKAFRPTDVGPEGKMYTVRLNALESMDAFGREDLSFTEEPAEEMGLLKLPNAPVYMCEILDDWDTQRIRVDFEVTV